MSSIYYMYNTIHHYVTNQGPGQEVQEGDHQARPRRAAADDVPGDEAGAPGNNKFSILSFPCLSHM